MRTQQRFFATGSAEHYLDSTIREIAGVVGGVLRESLDSTGPLSFAMAMLPDLSLLCRPWAGPPMASAHTLQYRIVPTLPTGGRPATGGSPAGGQSRGGLPWHFPFSSEKQKR
jgi:hypothetical protein